MAFPLSWNIDGSDLRPFLRDNDYAGLKAHLKATKPAALLIMDDLALAVRIKNEWLPDCHVIHRDYSAHEGGEWQATPPHVMVNRWKQQGHPEIIRYLTNEPSFDAATAKTFAGREAETMKLAREAGYTVVALNFSVGRPEPQWIDDGKFDAAYRAIQEYGHFFGAHEYYTLCLPASLMGNEALLDKSALQPSNWPRDKITLDTEGTHWLFRSNYSVKRGVEIGIGYMRVINTEFGFDNVENSGNADIIAQLRLAYGQRIYNYDMRGVNCYGRAWNDYYPGIDHNDVIRKQAEWWMEVKPDWVIGACFYGINFDWDVPQGHDWSADVRRGFFNTLEEMSAAMTEPTPEPQPEYDLDSVTWHDGTIRRAGAGYTNFREQPHRTGKDLGDIRDSADYAVAYVDFEKQLLWTHPGSSYTWVALKRSDGVIGYAVKNLIVIDVPVPEPPVEPPVEPPPPPPPIDEAKVKAIAYQVFDERIDEAIRSHIDDHAIPRPVDAAIIRTLRWMADTLEARLEEEIAPATTAQISNAVNAAVNEEYSEAAMSVLNANAVDDPPKESGDDAA